MRKYILSFIGLMLLTFSTVSAQQISIPRIDKMPNQPQPYAMRDWKKVAIDYDKYVFDASKTGTHLPLSGMGTLGQFNYADVKPIFMDTYVGAKSHGQQAEAINIMPAIVGASLVGVDKTTQFGQNWVKSAKDFFNKKNGQNVYLNNYSSQSGGDWWYDLMPNIYFYQLYNLYPTADNDFEQQFTAVAGRWLDATYKLGGKTSPWTIPNMNYRAFNLATGKPFEGGVKEPESAGTIAWLLYHAYIQTGDIKYLKGSQLALDFLQNWNNNPSYELQLPYGVLVAAKMNALESTNYDINKFTNWCFDRGALRGWGTIVGKWGGYDISGLIGEANDEGNDYAFIMNGFQHAAALVPMVKYDKRYAKAVGKWMLNLANASRLFYWDALPQSLQEPNSYNWASANDPDACIPYESMKEKWTGKSPYAMGDAVGGNWASTNLSLYSGSSVGYMAALINKTNVETILQLDLNKTDFYGSNKYPTYLYYNPNETAENIVLDLPSGANFDVYDAITETVLASNVANTFNFAIPSDDVRLLVVYPTGKTVLTEGRIKKADNEIIDYHVSYDFSPILRIKNLEANTTIVEKGNAVTIMSLVDNIPSGKTVTYQWSENGVVLPSENAATLLWNAPLVTGVYTIELKANTSDGKSAKMDIKIDVRDEVTNPPAINAIVLSEPMPLDVSTSINLTPEIADSDKITTYNWNVDGGNLSSSSIQTPSWTLPSAEGIYTISLEVTNAAGKANYVKQILVKNKTDHKPSPMIYYSFAGDAKNKIEDRFNGVVLNATPSSDKRGEVGQAYNFSPTGSMVYTAYDEALNFSDKIALSFWMNPANLPSNEQFIISHGSWEERYKISITTEKKLRWTLKTNKAIVDLDNPEIIEKNKFYHFAVLYTGYSMEIYQNGKLTAFAKHSGAISPSSKELTIGQKDVQTLDYPFLGIIDEVCLFSADLSKDLIAELPNIWSWNTSSGSLPALNDKEKMRIYPNPVKDYINILLAANDEISSIKLYTLGGALLLDKPTNENKLDRPQEIRKGLYIIQITTKLGKRLSKKVIFE